MTELFKFPNPTVKIEFYMDGERYELEAVCDEILLEVETEREEMVFFNSMLAYTPETPTRYKISGDLKQVGGSYGRIKKK